MVVVILSVLGLMCKVNKTVDQKMHEVDHKVRRNFERVDEVKDELSGKFVQVLVCDVKHQEIMRMLADLQTDVKLILRNGQRRENT